MTVNTLYYLKPPGLSRKSSAHGDENYIAGRAKTLPPSVLPFDRLFRIIPRDGTTDDFMNEQDLFTRKIRTRQTDATTLNNCNNTASEVDFCKDSPDRQGRRISLNISIDDAYPHIGTLVKWIFGKRCRQAVKTAPPRTLPMLAPEMQRQNELSPGVISWMSCKRFSDCPYWRN